jgi:hypothetical protein
VRDLDEPLLTHFTVNTELLLTICEPDSEYVRPAVLPHQPVNTVEDQELPQETSEFE